MNKFALPMHVTRPTSFTEINVKLKNILGTLCLLAGLLMQHLAFAADPLINKDYVLIQPVQTSASPGKIEVIEFFSYACPHCKSVNPVALAWAEKLPKDVVFKRVPVSFNRTYVNLAKLFYALEMTGDLQRLDADVFAAVHVQGIALFDESTASEWLAKKGVDKKKFVDAYRSSVVDGKVKDAHKMSEAYGVDGVPSFAVGGRYRVLNENISGFEDLVVRAERLIQKLRSERLAQK